jgi:hypothetical protein
MARIEFTPNLAKHLTVDSVDVRAASLREALDQCFHQNPRLRGYILDDQGRLRQHVAVFIDGALVMDRTHLTDSLLDSSSVFVMQALSGG